MFTQEDNDLIQREFESLRVASLKRCATKEEYEDVVRAFEFANEAHKGVRRRSGEPYIIHPIAVAKIVVQEIGLGYKSIVTALLHDIVEDTEYTVEDLERLFGPKVASLVDGLTKIKSAMDSKHNSNQNDEKSMQAENFKRILLTLNDDVRVVLIKLADRLHNLRTIGSMPERKKDKILSESMYIFIPLAHKLGLYSMKSEMENIWLRYREPEIYNKLSRRVENLTEERGDAIDQFISPIYQSLHDEGYKFTITKRTKTPYSIWKKMENKNIPFEQIYDLFAIRIIIDSEPQNEKSECWHVYSMIADMYTPNPHRLRDWLSVPKSNGYESLHTTVMGPEGRWVEVQIRTERMDEVAEKGVAAHWKYKGGKSDSAQMDEWLKNLRDLLEQGGGEDDNMEVMNEFKMQLYDDDVFVFTPKGDLHQLHRGSTVLDFAFGIHTRIGSQCMGAIVNGKHVSFKYELQNGDQVEVITSPTQTPRADWLNWTKTSKARSRIKQALKEAAHKEAENGREMLLRRLKNWKLEFDDSLVNRAARKLGYKTLMDFYVAINQEKVNLLQLRLIRAV